MTKRIIALITLFAFQLIFAQVQKPVTFDFKLNKLNDTEFEAVFLGKMEGNWHVYSQELPKGSGMPTEISVTSPEGGIELLGTTEEVGEKKDEYSEAFKARIIYFSKKVEFKQKFKLKDPSKAATIIGEIMFQTCDDRICLAPETLEFEKKIEAGGIIAGSVDNAEKNVAQNSGNNLKIESVDVKNPLVNCGIQEEKSDHSYLWILVLGFVGGLIALLTPCVFPMIPLTVSFFTKGSKDKSKGRRDAIIYGLFILVIFVLLSVPFHIIDGISGNIFNEISTNVWLNIAFFIIFLFFAFSFFGYYDITLPSWVANKSSKAEEAGGIIGIFFMALTLVIVSFSCTGPILGSLLGSVVSGSSDVPMLLTFALAGFGLSWAIVFGLLALFPQALQSLPKSGGWMNTLKVVLGFIELGLALKFLSKADLVSKTFLLKRELFIVLWILIALGLVLYLFGKIRFPHDDKNQKPGLVRKISGIIGIGFIIYLIQGLVPGERPKLQMLSGILPPINVSYLHKEEDGLLGMKPYHNFFDALEEAKKQNKVLMIDFTGYGCENCRKMEEFVWSEPDILPILQNDVVLASLYVDDKEKLPESEQKSVDIGNGQKKKIKTVGDQWSLFQTVNFNNNSQPHYVLLTPEGKVINNPVSGYMPKEDFKKFLTCGIDFFKSKK